MFELQMGYRRCRYRVAPFISDRFLPDKAIDLIDDAAYRLRIEIDSMPIEIDEIERKILQLEIERQALKRQEDRASQGSSSAFSQGGLAYYDET